MIYLDNAATSFPKPDAVYAAMDRFARTELANPGRAGHRMALASERVVDRARRLLNDLFGGADPDRIVFTLNCTDALNMALKGVLEAGDHVVTSELEHNSVSRPLRALEEAGAIEVTRVRADDGGFLDPAEVSSAIRPTTKLVAVIHASNVLGTVQPIAEIGRIARERGVLFLVDAAQTAGLVPIHVGELGIDLLAFPGHKGLLGPTGTGGLYVGKGVNLRPWREGGTGGDSSSPTQPRDLPWLLEGGTPNVHGIAGLVAGVEHVISSGVAALRAHEVDLVLRLADWAASSGTWRVHGRVDRRAHVGTVSISLPGVAAGEIGAILDQAFDIAVRPGLHCAPGTHRSIGTFPDGTVRVSPGPFSCAADIEALQGALEEIARESLGSR